MAGRAELSFSAACSSGFCLAEERSSVASTSDFSSVALFASDFLSERASSCSSSPDYFLDSAFEPELALASCLSSSGFSSFGFSSELFFASTFLSESFVDSDF